MVFRKARSKKEDIVYRKLSEAILDEIINTFETVASSYRPVGFLSEPPKIDNLSKEQKERLINLVINLTEYVLEGLDDNKELLKALKEIESDEAYSIMAKKIIGSLENPENLIGHILFGLTYDIGGNLKRDVYNLLLRVAKEYK